MKRFSGWNEEKVKEKKKTGKIKGFTIHHKSLKVVKLKKHKKRSKEKDWLGYNLQYWCNERMLTLEEEYRFHPARKWRFDYAIPAIKTAVEYEGIFSDKSRHTTVGGYNADTEKYNHASLLGWKVIRVTAVNYRDILKLLNVSE